MKNVLQDEQTMSQSRSLTQTGYKQDSRENSRKRQAVQKRQPHDCTSPDFIQKISDLIDEKMKAIFDKFEDFK